MDFLSEIDGKIGDGDHGINMNKGFSLCKNRLEDKEYTFSEGLSTLSCTLMEDIGGSMGPLYGVFFDEMSLACSKEINADVFEKMLMCANDGIQEIGNANRGDKTLLDTLILGLEAYSLALVKGKDFSEALDDLKIGAKAGWESTKDMIESDVQVVWENGLAVCLMQAQPVVISFFALWPIQYRTSLNNGLILNGPLCPQNALMEQ